MNKIVIIIMVLFFCSAAGIAQKPTLPPGTKPGQLPVPKNPQLLSPPDLRVEELSLVSITRDVASKKMKIQVLIRIKNYGELSSGSSTAYAYMRNPTGTGREKKLATTFPTPSIKPRGSFVKVFIFYETEASFRPGNFDFWLKADAQNVIHESNENNNNSTIINIEVPTR